MKKLLILSLIALAAPLASITPAGAAVPKRAPSESISCADGSGHWANLWWDAKHLAAKNRCDQWLVITVGSTNVSVAPGAHFNVRLTKLGLSSVDELMADLSYYPAPCGLTFKKNSHGKPRAVAC